MLELGLGDNAEGFSFEKSEALEKSLKKMTIFIVDIFENTEGLVVDSNSKLTRFMYGVLIAMEQQRVPKQISAIRKIAGAIEKEFDDNNWIIISNIYNYIFELRNSILNYYINQNKDTNIVGLKTA